MNRAKRDGLVSVIWRTPIGPMTGQVSARGLWSLQFPAANDQKLEGSAGGLRVEVGEREIPDELCGSARSEALRQVDQITEYLKDYFQGRAASRRPPVDWGDRPEFDRAVWEATARIPFGRTRSYGELAAAVGRPRAARAVGGAMGRNPLVLVVPCHRVLAAGVKGRRRLGGFTGGLALKERLLKHEAVVV